jgi:hypothetical protein
MTSARARRFFHPPSLRLIQYREEKKSRLLTSLAKSFSQCKSLPVSMSPAPLWDNPVIFYSPRFVHSSWISDARHYFGVEGKCLAHSSSHSAGFHNSVGGVEFLLTFIPKAPSLFLLHRILTLSLDPHLDITKVLLAAFITL